MPNPVVQRIVRRGRRQGQPRKYILSALAIGRVESNFRNLPGGDADSQGWRQERKSLYRNPRNLNASIDRVYREMRQHDRGQSAGELAADVQRPAAQYRSRYSQVLKSGEPMRLLRGQGGRFAAGGTRSFRTGGSFTPARASVGMRSVFDKQGYEKAVRRARVGQYLQQQGRGNSILFRSGLLSTEEPTPGDYTQSKLVSSLRNAKYKPEAVIQKGVGKYSAGRSPGGRLLEVFYDPIGGWDRPAGGKKLVKIGAIGGHGTHAHIGADPRLAIHLGKLAQRMGLSVRENPHFDKVDPVHTKGSLHYSRRAIDVSGDQQKLAAFVRTVMRRHNLR